MIYFNYISDVLLIREDVRSNIKSVSVSETLNLRESLTNNIHFVDVHEILLIKESLSRGGIYNLNIQETVNVGEKLAKTVFFCDIHEVLAVGENLGKDNIVDFLNINETLDFDKRSKVLDTVTFVEDLTFVATRSFPVNESLNIQESLTCIVLTTTRPCLIGPATNTKSITLSSLDGRYYVTVMSPDFGNMESMEYTRVNKRTRGGDSIIFRDSQWPKTTVFSYNWSNLLYPDRVSLLNFVTVTIGQVVNLLDYEGNNKLVFVRNPDTEFTIPQRHQNHVKLEFEEQ